MCGLRKYEEPNMYYQTIFGRDYLKRDTRNFRPLLDRKGKDERLRCLGVNPFFACLFGKKRLETGSGLLMILKKC